MCIYALAQAASADTAVHPYVSYDFFETRRNETEHEEISTHIFLTGDDYVGYRYRENVLGAMTQSAKSVAFENEYQRKATTEQQSAFLDELLNLKVFELKSEAYTAYTTTASAYNATLNIRIGAREISINFYSPPQSPSRKALHEAILSFAKRMGVDRPMDPQKATTITEGDSSPVRVVKLAEVLAHPDKYHGKRISVIGYYRAEFESSGVYIDEAASRSDSYKRGVWRSASSTFAAKGAISPQNNAWFRIEGIFLRGPAGHMGLWPGEITRLTRIEPVTRPD
jgi:hypothetical protein